MVRGGGGGVGGKYMGKAGVGAVGGEEGGPHGDVGGEEGRGVCGDCHAWVKERKGALVKSPKRGK